MRDRACLGPGGRSGKITRVIAKPVFLGPPGCPGAHPLTWGIRSDSPVITAVLIFFPIFPHQAQDCPALREGPAWLCCQGTGSALRPKPAWDPEGLAAVSAQGGPIGWFAQCAPKSWVLGGTLRAWLVLLMVPVEGADTDANGGEPGAGCTADHQKWVLERFQDRSKFLDDCLSS